MKCIPSPWLQVSHSNDIDIFDNITSGLLHAHKISQNRYSLLNETCLPENCITFWDNIFGAEIADDSEDID